MHDNENDLQLAQARGATAEQIDEAERTRIVRGFRLAVLASVFILAVGTVFYHVVEKFSWLDSVYFCMITLTTVGYGDIAPHTAAGKVFTIFYVVVGIGIIATMINLTVRRAVAGRRK